MNNNVKFENGNTAFKPLNAIEIITKEGKNLTKNAPYNKKIKQPKYLNPDQIHKLLDYVVHINYDHWFIFILAYRLGLRVTEVLTIEKGFFDPFTHTLTIKHLKSRHQEFRTVPLPDDLENLIRGYFAKYNNDELVFKYSRQRIHQLIKQYCSEVGLPSWVHFHTLRHSFAMNYYNQTSDSFGLRKLMGHSRLSTTNIYAEMNPTDLRERVNKIKF